MNSPFVHLAVDPQLACAFLGVFARFEYALKAAEFLQGDDNNAEPDWSSFARSIAEPFTAAQEAELSHAVAYLLDQPPRKQVILDGRLEWRAAPPDNNLSRAEQVFLMVRRVRNNLFHGGKFLPPEGNNHDRDQLLVHHALAVLQACIRLHPAVAAAYRE
jgi:hypothetical protein